MNDLTVEQQKKLFKYIYDINQICKSKGTYSVEKGAIIGKDFYGFVSFPELEGLPKREFTKVELNRNILDFRYKLDDPLLLFSLTKAKEDVFTGLCSEDNAIGVKINEGFTWFNIEPETGNPKVDDIKHFFENAKTVADIVIDLTEDKRELFKENIIKKAYDDFIAILPSNMFFSTATSKSTLELYCIGQDNMDEETPEIYRVYDLYVMETFPSLYLTLMQKVRIVNHV